MNCQAKSGYASKLGYLLSRGVSIVYPHGCWLQNEFETTFSVVISWNCSNVPLFRQSRKGCGKCEKASVSLASSTYLWVTYSEFLKPTSLCGQGYGMITKFFFGWQNGFFFILMAFSTICSNIRVSIKNLHIKHST